MEQAFYLHIKDENKLLNIIYDLDPDHFCIYYRDSNSFKYKTLSAINDITIVVPPEHYSVTKKNFKGFIDLGTLYQIPNGPLYSPLRDAYLFLDTSNGVSKNVNEILPQLELLGLGNIFHLLDRSGFSGSGFIDLRTTTLTSEMIELGLKSGAIVKTGQKLSAL